jgi:hypothetical protein
VGELPAFGIICWCNRYRHWDIQWVDAFRLIEYYFKWWKPWLRILSICNYILYNNEYIGNVEGVCVLCKYWELRVNIFKSHNAQSIIAND